jgi:hypothetical protein
MRGGVYVWLRVDRTNRLVIKPDQRLPERWIVNYKCSLTSMVSPTPEVLFIEIIFVIFIKNSAK